jgi:hypothetical protein
MPVFLLQQLTELTRQNQADWLSPSVVRLIKMSIVVVYVLGLNTCVFVTINLFCPSLNGAQSDFGARSLSQSGILSNLKAHYS